jgi:hypothetical protein
MTIELCNELLRQDTSRLLAKGFSGIDKLMNGFSSTISMRAVRPLPVEGRAAIFSHDPRLL